MKIEIDLNDYLDEQEIKQLAITYVKRNFDQKDFLERVLSNSSYRVVWDAVDAVFDLKAEELLREKVKNIIEGLSEFHVFKQASAWSRGNSAYDLMIRAVENNSDLLEDKVKEHLNNMSKSEVKKIASKVMEERLGKVL